ncbi:MAG: di-heme oxidoredictase family protein, partial [Candidatus Eiseniibacteriota bacterium]
TVFNNTSQAFSLPAANLTDPDLHRDGDAAFEAKFVQPPASANGGLGPIFSSPSCVGCHVGDGRGTLLLGGNELGSLLLRISLPGVDPNGTGGPNPVPGFGAQFDDHATFGVAPEGHVQITYTETVHQFADGRQYSLRTPTYHIVDAYTSFPADALISPRMALPVFGRGLLEAIPEASILALADESDADGDGISGRPNYVYDFVSHTTVLGRFGWKANQPSLPQQVAAAYRGDMGVTNPIFTAENAQGQPQDDGLADDPEISMGTVEAATFYTQTLGVPARRNVNDPVVLQGRRAFDTARCGSCHTPTFVTGMLPGVPEVSHQTIHPYTDLLLHDMGEDLADGRPDFQATGREWRTPPLWGIGLTEVVQGQAFYLHDGRARTLMEAIMSHGGEATVSREAVRKMEKADRDALILFLQSL